MLLYKFFALVLVCATVAACGFQPLYYRDGTRSSIRADLQGIHVRPIADRIGQELRIDLQTALSPTSEQAPREWELDVELSEKTQKIAIKATSFSTRANLIVKARIELIPVGEAALAITRKPYKAKLKAVSSYNLVDLEYANLIAERNARSKIAALLGNDIRLHLALWLRADGG